MPVPLILRQAVEVGNSYLDAKERQDEQGIEDAKSAVAALESQSRMIATKASTALERKRHDLEKEKFSTEVMDNQRRYLLDERKVKVAEESAELAGRLTREEIEKRTMENMLAKSDMPRLLELSRINLGISQELIKQSGGMGDYIISQAAILKNENITKKLKAVNDKYKMEGIVIGQDLEREIETSRLMGEKLKTEYLKKQAAYDLKNLQKNLDIKKLLSDIEIQRLTHVLEGWVNGDTRMYREYAELTNHTKNTAIMQDLGMQEKLKEYRDTLWDEENGQEKAMLEQEFNEHMHQEKISKIKVDHLTGNLILPEGINFRPQDVKLLNDFIDYQKSIMTGLAAQAQAVDETGWPKAVKDSMDVIKSTFRLKDRESNLLSRNVSSFLKRDHLNGTKQTAEFIEAFAFQNMQADQKTIAFQAKRGIRALKNIDMHFREWYFYRIALEQTEELVNSKGPNRISEEVAAKRRGQLGELNFRDEGPNYLAKLRDGLPQWMKGHWISAFTIRMDKLGTLITDRSLMPKVYIELDTLINQELSILRQSMTGAAFSAQETRDYKLMLPNVASNMADNAAKINTMLTKHHLNLTTAFGFILTPTAYKELRPEYYTKPGTLPFNHINPEALDQSAWGQYQRRMGIGKAATDAAQPGITGNTAQPGKASERLTTEIIRAYGEVSGWNNLGPQALQVGNDILEKFHASYSIDPNTPSEDIIRNLVSDVVPGGVRYDFFDDITKEVLVERLNRLRKIYEKNLTREDMIYIIMQDWDESSGLRKEDTLTLPEGEPATDTSNTIPGEGHRSYYIPSYHGEDQQDRFNPANPRKALPRNLRGKSYR